MRGARKEQGARAEASRPDVIVTANIGCLTHLESGTQTPVRHWIELLDTRDVERTTLDLKGKPADHERPPARNARPLSLTFSRSRRAGWNNDSYGHINNVTYYSYFDTAVNEHLINAGGLDIRNGPVVGVVEMLCRFHRPLSFPETVDVGLRVTRLGTTSVTYEIGLFAGSSDGPAATGRFVHVWVDRETERPAAVPARIRAVLAPLVVAATESQAT